MLDEKTQKFREAVQTCWWYIVEEASFKILDEQEEIWFAWMHTPEKPDQSFPMIGRGIADREHMRLTTTALTTLMMEG